MRCPFCGEENLAGIRQCEHCGQDLTGLDATERSPGGREVFCGATLGDAPMLAPIVVGPDDSVACAVEEMRRRRLGSVFVVSEHKLVGIFTEADLLQRIEPGSDLAAIPLASVMTPKPATYRSEDTVCYALNAMSAWEKRHLPILDDKERLVGFVGVRTVLTLVKDRAGL